MTPSELKLHAISQYLEAEKELRELKVLISKHSFTSQIGEWLVAEIYDGVRAESGVQKGWDVCANGKNIQVKTHAKSIGNNSNFSAVSSDSSEKIDELIIINFSPTYKLLEFYKLDWQIALNHIKYSGKKNPREELNWATIRDYRIPLEQLPKQEIVRFFMPD